MAQKDAKTTDGSERASGYIREVADAAKAGVDKASDYLEGVTDQVELVTGAMNETQEQVAAFGSRRIDDVWADTLRYTKRRPGMALLIAGAVGLTARRLIQHDETGASLRMSEKPDGGLEGLRSVSSRTWASRSASCRCSARPGARTIRSAR